METGIDLVEVARMERASPPLGFGSGFFSPGREEIRARPNRAQSVPRFCRQRGLCQGYGNGLPGIRLVEIELLHDGSGKPELHLSGAAGEFAQSSGLAFSVSLTHTRQHAAAVVVAYSDREKEQQGWKL